MSASSASPWLPEHPIYISSEFRPHPYLSLHSLSLKRTHMRSPANAAFPSVTCIVTKTGKDGALLYRPILKSPTQHIGHTSTLVLRTVPHRSSFSPILTLPPHQQYWECRQTSFVLRGDKWAHMKLCCNPSRIIKRSYLDSHPTLPTF